jgi:predicted Rossmann fold flavoprotein
MGFCPASGWHPEKNYTRTRSLSPRVEILPPDRFYGDGYRFAQQAGHTIVPLRASLVPIETVEDWCAKAQGLSLKNITLSATDFETNKVIFSEQGEMLFTHYGISGPLVLSLSAHLSEPFDRRYRLWIDLKPALDEQALDARILRDFSENANKDFGNSLDRLLPRKLIPVIIRLSGIKPDTKVNQITKEQRRRLCGLLKALPLTPWRFRPVEEAVVTSGGGSVSEINPKTMESKLVPVYILPEKSLMWTVIPAGLTFKLPIRPAMRRM